MARERIAIIGAGIGGLVAALALTKRNFAVTVHERSRVLEEAGAGIQLSPNAMRILIGLGLWPALASRIVQPEAIVVRNGRDGEEIVRMPLSGAQERWGAPYGVIHRADLQRALVEAARREALLALELNSRFISVRQRAEVATATIERDGSLAMVDADAVIGADGLWSSVAPELGRRAPPTFAGRRAWRAVVPIAHHDALPLANETTLWLGPGAHLVRYPVSAGTAANLVAVVRDAGDTGGWSEPGLGPSVAGHFRGWHRDVVSLVSGHAAWQGWPLFDRPAPGPFAVGRLALLGDAVHPMLPFMAQAGAMAIEDGAVLAASLDRTGPMAARLAAYGLARRDRVERVGREARANAARYHWGRPLDTIRNAAMRVAGGEALLSRYDWLYGWRPPEP